ncbi:MAG TPA: MBL fold metallo-hydrolase [Acidimicrobiia bacterium]|nr:MBL fold metallo-hydrolase [Acidimicrobiia bacterium]
MAAQTDQWRTEFRVGDRRVLGVADGVFTMNDDFMNVPGYNRQFEDASGRAQLPVGSFVVEGDQTVLIDAGIGPFATEGLVGGNLLAELAAIGVQPADVDVVAVSHLHLDHDGWIATRDGGVTFPNAVVHVGAGDYEHFVVGTPTDGFTMARHKKAALAELLDAGRVVLVDDVTEIVPGVVAMPTPGHTPGHLAFAIRDRGERLLILGDSMYCPAQLTDMDLTAMHDVDPALARRSRELIAREMEAHATSAVGCHFPGLHAARVLGGEVVAA